MKRLIYLLSVTIILAVSCNKEDNKPDETDYMQIHFLKSALGGCNSKTEENITRGEEKNDTVIFSLTNDTLTIHAGINYICCAPFITDCNVSNDSIFITITDSCPNPNQCYCRCSCYYTFDYYFDSITDNEYYWQIIINDPREENRILFGNGKISVQKL